MDASNEVPASVPKEEAVTQDLIIVSRLLKLYSWPNGFFKSILSASIDDILKHAPSEHMIDGTRPEEDEWHYGRVRFFVDELNAGKTLDPIVVDNRCDRGHIYPEPIVIDGHHRLCAVKVSGVRTVPANYSGRVDLLDYLTGKCDRPPL